MQKEERAGDNNWLDDIDNSVCAFKRKRLSWVNSACKEQQSSKHSSGSIRNQSSIHSNRNSESKGS